MTNSRKESLAKSSQAQAANNVLCQLWITPEFHKAMKEYAKTNDISMSDVFRMGAKQYIGYNPTADDIVR